MAMSPERTRSDPRSPWRRLRLAGIAAALLASAAMAPVAQSAEPELPPLTTEAGTPRLPGKFVWIDLVTSNMETARNFYSRLFGWEFRRMGDAATGYSLVLNDGRPVGGVVDVTARPNVPVNPRWVAYISVPDVAQAQKAIIGAGGRQLVAAKTFPKRGEQAVFADAEGAVFGVIKSAGGDPADFMAEPGDWIWIQLLSRDVQKATGFYRSFAGYEVVEDKESSRKNQFLLVSGAFARAAVSQLPANHPKAPPIWLPFVRVESLAQSLTVAQQLGGRIAVMPRPDLFEGRMAVVADPSGAMVGMLQWDDERDQGRKTRP
jgi:predicted enzyme related to lactoylglutathione lyase